jgi:hypothetical protein
MIDISAEIVQDWTREQCLERIKEIEQAHNVTTTITRYTDEIDRIVNAILYLEGRIEEITISEAALKGAETRLKTTGFLPAIMTPRGRAENLKEAAELMGYKETTIHTYITNKPDQYYRCE